MYRERIAKLAPGYDPAHVEACMRCHSISIESMSTNQFEAAVGIARLMIDDRGLEAMDHVARSFGLKPQPRKATT